MASLTTPPTPIPHENNDATRLVDSPSTSVQLSRTNDEFRAAEFDGWWGGVSTLALVVGTAEDEWQPPGHPSSMVLN
ncbi:hypothetical protein PILCRDRAFT_2744 [Piloderma croceum F 1598]|uniref:Uncharacterized protein n=1 Tax=Piloderma croceum (strain F 1598) TaxID=765440 RepID=A0A0C3GCZ6_PILCF|nr:hypothetical protein PILCRDRAFT_2744 [Piloderma croceum F 1598]